MLTLFSLGFRLMPDIMKCVLRIARCSTNISVCTSHICFFISSAVNNTDNVLHHCKHYLMSVILVCKKVIMVYMVVLVLCESVNRRSTISGPYWLSHLTRMYLLQSKEDPSLDCKRYICFRFANL